MSTDTSQTSSTASIPEARHHPQHVAVIMDGNGRWAKRKGLNRISGHKQGAESVRELVKCCVRKKVESLTLFAFSSENWRRPRTEVNLLMQLLTNALENEVRKLHDNDVRLKIIGDLSRFSERIRKLVGKAEALTRDNCSLNLNIAINYGGRWDIIQACRRIADAVGRGELSTADIDESLFESYTSTAGLAEPDLFIRTGGEKRVSNFLLWQLAYTELYMTDILWPDFRESEFDAALSWFSSRQRRFGQTGEQIDARNQKIQNA